MSWFYEFNGDLKTIVIGELFQPRPALIVLSLAFIIFFQFLSFSCSSSSLLSFVCHRRCRLKPLPLSLWTLNVIVVCPPHCFTTSVFMWCIFPHSASAFFLSFLAFVWSDNGDFSLFLQGLDFWNSCSWSPSNGFYKIRISFRSGFLQG